MKPAGQGCPRSSRPGWAAVVETASGVPCAEFKPRETVVNLGPAVLKPGVLLLMLLASWCGWAGSLLAAAPAVECELRVVWGGGGVRSFDAVIQVQGGTFEPLRNLSLQDDSVGTIRRVSPQELQVLPHSASTFGGVDLRVRGTTETTLEFRWREAGGEYGPPMTAKLSEILAGRWMQPLDQRGSRVAVERLVHDRIRVSLDREQPIYSAGETCPVRISGNHTGLAPGEYRMRLRLLSAATNKTVFLQTYNTDLDSQGSFPPVVVEAVALPAQPGVYTFEVSLQRKRFVNSILSSIAMAERRLEIVVTDPEPLQREDGPESVAGGEWRLQQQVFPAGATWWDALGKFKVPTPRVLTPLVSYRARPLGSAEHVRREYMGQDCLVLANGAWQAFPLSVQAIARPHRVRVRVPADRPMNLVLSIQEPNAGGDAVGLRLDSGMVVDPRIYQGRNLEYVEHSLVFWPRSEQPYLLLFNPDGKREATVAAVEVDVAEGPLTAAPAARELLEQEGGRAAGRQPTRLVAVHLDKPLLAENFGAQRVLDNVNQRGMDSWQTWMDASQRLAAYTQWAGYNAATLTVAAQGGCIYPSRVLEPSPKFDSGVFLSDGSDPEIKDLVELVCREFDRRGLRLVVAVDLEGALPELARWEHSTPVDASLFQVDAAGNSWRGQDRRDQARSVRYNPLDSRVQVAIENVVKEIVQRYGQHRCFAGVQLTLSNRSHLTFAGDRWGYDAASLSRFERAVGSRLPEDAAQRAKLLQGALRSTYLNHRANELSLYFRRLGEVIGNANPEAQLILNPARMFAAPPDADSFQDVEQVLRHGSEFLLACGLQPQETDAASHVLWLRPDNDALLRSPVARSWHVQVGSDESLDAALAVTAAGSTFQQVPHGYQLPDFDAVSPFGSDKTRAWLFPHASYAGPAARRQLLHRLQAADPLLVAHGGWLATMGQEQELRPLLSLLGALPAATFEDYDVQGASQTLRVRRLVSGERTWYQIAHHGSWQEAFALDFLGSRSAGATSVVPRDGRLIAEKHQLIQRESELAECAVRLDLEPWSMAIVCFDQAGVELQRARGTAEAGVAERLEQRLLKLQGSIDRVSELRSEQVLGLVGGDFEQWESDAKPQGWTASALPNVRVAREVELPHSGRYCVRIENSGTEGTTAWIQSDRIAVPPTGRMAVEMWVRSAPGLAQPGLRLSLIGRYRDGKRFHRWHDFTRAGQSSPQIPVDWGKRPLVLLVPDVPSEDLVELNVAVDVIGPGKLWVDDIRVYGMYLHPDEKVHLIGQLYLAKEKLKAGELAVAEELSQSYWAYFLTSFLNEDGTPAMTVARSTAAPPGSGKDGSAVTGSEARPDPAMAGVGKLRNDGPSAEANAAPGGVAGADTNAKSGAATNSGPGAASGAGTASSAGASAAGGKAGPVKSASQPRSGSWQDSWRGRWQK
jgi:hypothetical protein